MDGYQYWFQLNCKTEEEEGEEDDVEVQMQDN